MIRYLCAKEWKRIKRFVESSWGRHHPLTDERLFLWQHSGPRSNCDCYICTVYEDCDQIVGLRGMQHLDFQIVSAAGDLQIISGCSAPFLFVLKEHRGFVGLRLYKKTIEDFPIILFLGSNKQTSLKLHKKFGYQIFNNLPRFGLQNIDKRSCERASVQECDINTKLLSQVWERFSRVLKPFSIHRSEAFFEWRYVNAPYWKYRMFFSSDASCVAVYRSEKITKDGITIGKAMRVIELFYDPKNTSSENFVSFINGFVAFSKWKNYQFVDHFQTMPYLQSMLKRAGFFEVRNKNPNFPVMFDPIDFTKPPINYGWFISSEVTCSVDPSDNHYVVKSDSDQDRPIPT